MHSFGLSVGALAGWSTRKFFLFLVGPLCAVAAALHSIPADAQTGSSPTVFLSGGATTTAPCNPCGSLGAALATVSPGGNIVCQTGGQFWPQSAITASVTIDCHDNLATIISCGGVTINAPGATVALRNVAFLGQNCGSYDGVVIQAAAMVQLEDITASGFQNGVVDQRSGTAALVIKHATIRNNILSGISFVPTGTAQLHVADSLVTSNGTSGTQAGISIKPSSGASATVSIERTQVAGNRFGVFADGTGGGTIRGVVKDSVVSGNVNNGISVNTNGTNAGLMVDNTEVSGNNYGLAVGGTNGLILVRRSSITANNNGLSAGGGGSLVTYRDNTLNNNSVDGAFSFALGTQ